MAFKSLATSGIINFAKYQNALVGNAGFDPSSDFLITETLISTNTATVTFSSIPSTYKHLQIRVVARTDRSAYDVEDVNLKINGASGTSYTLHTLTGDGTSVTSFGNGDSDRIDLVPTSTAASPTSAFGANIVDILDYANTSKFKTVRILGGMNSTSYKFVRLSSGSYKSTSAVSTITVSGGAGGNFIAGTRISLYGGLG